MESGARHRSLILAVVLAVGTPSAGAAQTPTDSLPAGVTPEQIQEGKQLFAGAGLCLACHGPEAKGGIGPDLTAGPWLHGAGSFQELIDRILRGVPLDESKGGQMMPPRGGGGLTDQQIRAVAAYVWTLSRKKPPAPAK